jgi:hypothetical protein
MAPMLHFFVQIVPKGNPKSTAGNVCFFKPKNGSIEKTDHDRMTFFFHAPWILFLVGYDRRIGFRISAQLKK